MTKNNVMAIILSAFVNCMTFSSYCWIFVSCIRYFEFCDLIVSGVVMCFHLKTVSVTICNEHMQCPWV